MSFLSSQYGWAANNVVNYEVVLANGTVVDANEKEHTGKRFPPWIYSTLTRQISSPL